VPCGGSVQFCSERPEKKPRELAVRMIFLAKSASVLRRIGVRRRESGDGRPEEKARTVVSLY
jgi:hypothetical protein